MSSLSRHFQYRLPQWPCCPQARAFPMGVRPPHPAAFSLFTAPFPVTGSGLPSPGQVDLGYEPPAAVGVDGYSRGGGICLPARGQTASWDCPDPPLINSTIPVPCVHVSMSKFPLSLGTRVLPDEDPASQPHLNCQRPVSK